MEPRTRIATRSYGAPPPLLVERRAAPRTACRIPAVVEADGGAVETVLRDVSLSGAFVECNLPLEERQRIRLRLEVPTLFVPIAIRAEVRWIQRGPAGDVIGGGVRFDGMRAVEMRAWVRYLRSPT